MLLAIYFIAVLELAVSVYDVWSLEEIRRYYEKTSSNKKISTWANKPPIKVARLKGHWD